LRDARAGYRNKIGGDVDGDGIGDHLVSAVYDSTGVPNGGAVYVARGPVTGTTSLEDVDAKLLGETTYSAAGWAMTTGDSNGDGLDDVAVGACYGGPGLAYLLYSPISGTFSLGSSDIVFEGVSGRVGQAVAMADVDDDGLVDVAVGAPSEDDVGKVHLCYSPLTGHVDLSGCDASFTGGSESFTGSEVLFSDFDGNGREDLAIGAYQAGAAYVFLDLP
jgi:hypothetical protein